MGRGSTASQAPGLQWGPGAYPNLLHACHMGAVLPRETLTGRTELNRVHIHCNAVSSLRHHCPFGPVSFFCFPLSFCFSSLFLSCFLSKGPRTEESSNLERPGPAGRRRWGLGVKKGMVVLGWGLKLVGRGEKGELPGEQSGVCIGSGDGACGSERVCTCKRVAGGYGPNPELKPSYLLSHLCLGNPTPSRIPVTGRSQKPVTPPPPQGSGQWP